MINLKFSIFVFMINYLNEIYCYETTIETQSNKQIILDADVKPDIKAEKPPSVSPLIQLDQLMSTTTLNLNLDQIKLSSIIKPDDVNNITIQTSNLPIQITPIVKLPRKISEKQYAYMKNGKSSSVVLQICAQDYENMAEKNQMVWKMYHGENPKFNKIAHEHYNNAKKPNIDKLNNKIPTGKKLLTGKFEGKNYEHSNQEDVHPSLKQSKDLGQNNQPNGLNQNDLSNLNIEKLKANEPQSNIQPVLSSDVKLQVMPLSLLPDQVNKKSLEKDDKNILDVSKNVEPNGKEKNNILSLDKDRGMPSKDDPLQKLNGNTKIEQMKNNNNNGNTNIPTNTLEENQLITPNIKSTEPSKIETTTEKLSFLEKAMMVFAPKEESEESAPNGNNEILENVETTGGSEIYTQNNEEQQNNADVPKKEDEQPKDNAEKDVNNEQVEQNVPTAEPSKDLEETTAVQYDETVFSQNKENSEENKVEQTENPFTDTVNNLNDQTEKENQVNDVTPNDMAEVKDQTESAYLDEQGQTTPDQSQNANDNEQIVLTTECVTDPSNMENQNENSSDSNVEQISSQPEEQPNYYNTENTNNGFQNENSEINPTEQNAENKEGQVEPHGETPLADENTEAKSIPEENNKEKNNENNNAETVNENKQSQENKDGITPDVEQPTTDADNLNTEETPPAELANVDGEVVQTTENNNNGPKEGEETSNSESANAVTDNTIDITPEGEMEHKSPSENQNGKENLVIETPQKVDEKLNEENKQNLENSLDISTDGSIVNKKEDVSNNIKPQSDQTSNNADNANIQPLENGQHIEDQNDLHISSTVIPRKKSDGVRNVVKLVETVEQSTSNSGRNIIKLEDNSKQNIADNKKPENIPNNHDNNILDNSGSLKNVQPQTESSPIEPSGSNGPLEKKPNVETVEMKQNGFEKKPEEVEKNPEEVEKKPNEVEKKPNEVEIKPNEVEMKPHEIEKKPNVENVHDLETQTSRRKIVDIEHTDNRPDDSKNNKEPTLPSISEKINEIQDKEFIETSTVHRNIINANQPIDKKLNVNLPNNEIPITTFKSDLVEIGAITTISPKLEEGETKYTEKKNISSKPLTNPNFKSSEEIINIEPVKGLRLNVEGAPKESNDNNYLNWLSIQKPNYKPIGNRFDFNANIHIQNPPQTTSTTTTTTTKTTPKPKVKQPDSSGGKGYAYSRWSFF